MPVSPQIRCTAFQGDRRIAVRRTGGRRLAGQGCRRPRRRRPAVRRRHQPHDRTGFPRHCRRRPAAPDGDGWRTAPPPAAALPEASPRAPDAPGSAWSPARSPCCPGTGSGSAHSPAAPRWRYASWSSRLGAPATTRSASGNRRRQPIVSWSRWPATVPGSRRQREPCSPARATASTRRPPPGRRTCATTLAGSPRPLSANRERRRASPRSM